jgi:hypothetical protein
MLRASEQADGPLATCALLVASFHVIFICFNADFQLFLHYSSVFVFIIAYTYCMAAQ